MQRQIALGERLAVALVSFLAAVLTIAFLGSIAFFAGAITTIEYAKTIALWSIVTCMGAGLAGFLLGGERAAYWFGVLWGTQAPTEKQLVLVLGFVVLVCGVIVYVMLA